VFNIDTHPFAALNTSLLDDGVAVFIAKGVAIETPIHIVTVTGNDLSAEASAKVDGAPVTAHPRVLIVAGENSRARIGHTFIGTPGSVYFNNSVSEVVVGEGAVVEYYTDQRESDAAFHIANLQAHVSAKGVFASHAFLTGAKIMRHDIGIALKGEGADCTMNGVYLVDGERLMDTHTSLDHAMPHCTSHELYKGILAGKSKAVFNGRIIVRLDAQKTDAKQTNRALLLSDDATINSNPQLEIFADDVKCTHGAAVGQLDEEAMFYLQARGLSRPEARDMLLHAFAGEVIEGVKIPALREQIETNFFATLARDIEGRR
jgi:Fe-S cluster assembly protein SufD